jgi:uncharacterized membrane protein
LHNATERTTLSKTLSTIINKGPTINNDNSKQPIEFVNTEQYSPVVYLPQVLAMLFSKVINLSIADTFYLVRIIGFLAWLIICTYAIKKMKVVGWAVSILLLTPLSVSVASSISADGMTIAYSVLFIGIVIEALMAKTISNKMIILLAIAAVLLASAKVPYEILVFLVLLIPADKFTNSRQRFILLSVMATILVLVMGSWLFISQKDYVSYRTLTTGIPINEKIQEAFLLNHPLSFAHKLYDTYLRVNPYSYDPIWGIVGVLTSIGFSIPEWAIALYFLSLGVVLTKIRNGANNEDYLSKAKRWYSFGLAVMLFLAINAAVYVSWSREKVQIIEGIQSRYFIPLSLLAVFFLLPVYKKKANLTNNFYYFFSFSVVIIQLAAIASIYYQFYAFPMPVIS